MFKVIGTNSYMKELVAWPKDARIAAEKLPAKLKENPFAGRLLTHNLHEKRIEGRRVYFLVYDDLELILLVATSGKKDQQKTIDYIKSQFIEFRKIAEELIKQGL